MAELVAGAFLSSFFQVIFDRLASSNFTDYFHRGKLDKLVEELESTLDLINQVLDDAEIKQYQIPEVKKWLGNVKHAMYEADQLLDEIATDAPLKKLKAESQPSTSHNIVNFIPTFTNPFESRIKDLMKSLHSLVEEKDKLQLKNQTCAGNAVVFNSKPSGIEETTCLVDASGIYGRDGDKEEMIKILLSSENGSSNQTPIISGILGLGGMGKTTFAKLVYNDNMIEEHFELKAWVYVSESFDVVGLTKEILKTFNSSAEGESNLNLLQLRLQQTLTGKKYLLVLDDIWNGNKESWEKLLLPFNHGSSGSKIIVTTRDKEITYVLKSTKLFNLQQLNKNDCWSLFVIHAFDGKNLDEYPHLERIGKKIVDKCGGLPLGVKTLGQLLRRKFSEHEWSKILETDMWRLSDEDNNINPVLRLSFHNLPSNQKRCFAYCSIYPKGYRFSKDGLIKFWMAEGLLNCRGADKSEEELGNEIFGDLESISFFQKSSYKFVMHDLVNDLAKSVSGEFCMQIEGSKVEGIPERTRHIWLSLQIIYCGDKLLEPICERKGLRSLILEKDWTATLISNNVQRDLFSRLTCLRMLIFSGCGLSKLVDEIGNLKLLRYLELAENKITSLPDTICALYNLQTLLLQRCELTELPSNFSELINLRHLELPDLKKMPKNIGKLSNLQTLNYFIVEEQNRSGIKELANINNLHGKIKITGLGNVIDHADAAKANLKDKKYLEELYMVFDGRREEMNDLIVESTVSVLEALQPNSNLKKLTIENYNGNRFPNWLRGYHLSNLVSLKLKSCRLCSHLAPLGQLPCLEELSISHCDQVKTIGEEFYDNNNSTTSLLPFRSLEFLQFEKMDNWEEWVCLEGFPLLKKLCIRECPKLKRVPPQHLHSLQELEISDCNKLEECLCLQGSPLLKKLCIRECPKLKSAPLPQHLPSLQKLEITDCKMLEASIPKGDNIEELELWRCDLISVNELPTNLKRFVLWENRYTEFSKEQNLLNCSVLEELMFDLRVFPSLDLRCYNSLRRLSISGCDSSSSLPFSLHLFTNLQSLNLYDCPQLESFPRGGLPSNLNWLQISNCPKLIGSREEWGLFQLNSLEYFIVSDEFENVESFPEENLLPPTLKWLWLENCSKLRRMNNKGFLHLNSLDYLGINSCPSLESLPEEGLQQLSSLSELWITECPIIREKYKKEGGERWHTISHIPNLESFPRGGLPSNLSSLRIWNCPKLIGSREEWGLFQLNSLKTFAITDEFENVESFPEENLLPPTLEVLCLNNCSKLRIMNNKGFLHLNSLKGLSIYKCPSLESLPEEGLQQLSSLSILWIDECPIIREKYKKEGGERWHTISHIPNVSI
ncbi:putative disease resistance RPP13 protein [Trifolium repens]|nr:putative disease resistance RPP13 protein [Trifolium repens]